MQFLGMSLPPSAIDLPRNISFPLYRRPCLYVVARGRGAPIAGESFILTVEVTNVSEEPVEVTDIYAGYIHTSFPTEALLGGRTMKLPLYEFAEGPMPPCALRTGESVAWTANLSRSSEQVEGGRVDHRTYSRYFDPRSHEDFEGRMRHRGRLMKSARNTAARMSERRLAVLIRDDCGSLHKAKVRWEPPEDGSSASRHRSAS